MIQVRDVFQVRFGKIDQAVQLFGAMRETLAQRAPDVRAHVLVDMTVEQPNAGWSGPGAVVVRNGFRAFKWQIRPAVDLLKRYGALLVDFGVGRNPRCLTDASGEMFTAVIEIETPGLSEWQGHRRELFRQPEFQVWFNQLMVHVAAGFHEFFTVV